MGTILENIARRISELEGNEVLIGQNVAAAIAAMRKGIKSEEWEFYMTQFATDSNGTLDSAKLARLMGTDGTLGDPVMDRKRGYLIGNAMCGDTTITETGFGVASIDDGVGTAKCARSFPICPDGTTTPKPGSKKPTYKKSSKK